MFYLAKEVGKFGHVLAEKKVTMVKPEKFDHLHLGYHFTIPLRTHFYRKPLVAASGNNEQQRLSEGFANICCRIVSPILLQEVGNDFAVCKHYSGTLLIVENVTSSHGFGN